jgi:hypothetical protein
MVEAAVRAQAMDTNQQDFPRMANGSAECAKKRRRVCLRILGLISR